jgi:signal transduction histidine kinase
VTSSSLVDRLAAHRMLADVPRDQLEWLASHGRVRRVAAGEVVIETGGMSPELMVVLSGHLSISIRRAGALRQVTEWRGGDITGMLPYSRAQRAPGDVIAQEATETLVVHRDCFLEMVRECHELTSVLVHEMLDRARYFRSSELHDEKMHSLGRLSAGLAHELNNPASAVARSGKSLAAGLVALDQASLTLAAAGLTADQLARVYRIRDARRAGQGRAQLSAVELVAREDAIADWLDRHGIDSGEVDAMMDADVSPADLDELGAFLEGPALAAALRYLAASCTARRLTHEIETAASRIHALVSAVKGFTYMDQAAVPGPVDLGQGLSDSLTVLRAKARAKKVDLRHQIEPDLPPVLGFGGELNQVWSNLIDNALDAAAETGHVLVTAARYGRSVIVRVADDGPGIPAEIQDRIFDPFFTTKGIGQGTGLGLDAARRIVEAHHGAIEVKSGSSGTEFQVMLPIAAPGDEAPQTVSPMAGGEGRH